MIRETDLQSACITWLEYTGWSVIRLNSGHAFVQGKNGKSYKIRLCPEGTPDLLSWKPSKHGQGYPLLVFWEIKVPGEEPRTRQVIRMAELELYGAICRVVHSLDELEQQVAQL